MFSASILSALITVEAGGSHHAILQKNTCKTRKKTAGGKKNEERSLPRRVARHAE
jgi:hypothetical protein